MKSVTMMLNLIIQFAEQDNNILAVTINGSRVNDNCICDEYSDFDIQYIVNDIKPYLTNKEWIKYFGEPLIIQEPEDWFSHPYNLDSKDQYPFLLQFCDGNRIDLVFVNKDKLDEFNKEIEPRKILLNKNTEIQIKEINHTESFNIIKPTEKEFLNIINEFLWLTLYVLKGINRKELTYAKIFLDNYENDLLYKMISWKIGVDNGFNISLGKSYKYLNKYLTENEMIGISKIYSTGSFEDISIKLQYLIDLFQENVVYVGKKLKYTFDIEQFENIKNYIRKRI